MTMKREGASLPPAPSGHIPAALCRGPTETLRVGRKPLPTASARPLVPLVPVILRCGFVVPSLPASEPLLVLFLRPRILPSMRVHMPLGTPVSRLRRLVGPWSGPEDAAVNRTEPASAVWSLAFELGGK